jgi:GNAT superfamily N-acetyltransferase
MTIHELPTTASAPATDIDAKIARLFDLVNFELTGDDLLVADRGSIGSTDQDLNAPRKRFVCWQGSQLAGHGAVEWRTTVASSRDSWQDVHVHPDHRSRGVGTRLADHLEEIARNLGQKRIIAHVNSSYGPGRQHEPPTGFGSVPAANPEVRFLLRRGFVLRQVNRVSRLPLPLAIETASRLRDDARRAAGNEYRPLVWADLTPPEYLEAMATQLTTVWNDAPLAGVPYPGSGDPQLPWTAERVAREERSALANGRRQVVAAIEHVQTGHIVGSTSLLVPRDTDHVVNNGPTVVSPDHRGRKLSALLKATSLLELERVFPGHPAVITQNAEENRAMLRVNEGWGFAPFYANGAWTKDL